MVGGDELSRPKEDVADEDGTSDTFDIAVNFRYQYPLDLKRIAAMGVKTYSFSISWSRVMPLGSGYVSQEGLDFYKNLTREVQKNGMKPVATLFHWDTPLALEQDYGSFTSERIVDDFTNYAALMFKELGAEGVNTWITFNEPPGEHARLLREIGESDIFRHQSSVLNASCFRCQAFVASMLHPRTLAGYARATFSKHTAEPTSFLIR